MKGYAVPLYILPFDHRSTFAKKLLELGYPTKETAEVTKYKKIVFEAFKKACTEAGCPNYLGVLVDEEFGLSIINDAKKCGVNVAIPVEKSGKDVFNFEHGAKFGEHISKISPTFVKALVRYNPANKKDNALQRKRLKQLSDYCIEHDYKFMLELLVPATPGQLAKVTGNGKKFDKTIRPKLAAQAINEIYSEGIEPDVWKIEALETLSAWKEINKVIRDERKHRNVGIIVLGRGENKKQVDKWIATAAKSGLVNGFAVGRTVFYQPLEDYRNKKISKAQAIDKIAKNYLHLIDLWQCSRK